MGFMEYVVKMASYVMIYVPSFMAIGTGIEATLNFGLRNLRGCNMCTADWTDLRIMPLI
jgi:hypothetical protein